MSDRSDRPKSRATEKTYLECAGSIPMDLIPRGNNDPMTTLEATIMNNAIVMANVSGHGVKNTSARPNPATAKIIAFVRKVL